MIISIPFFLVVVVLVGLAIWFRHQIADLVVGITDYTIGGLIMAWPIVRNTLLVAFAVAVIGWVILLVLMVCLGAYSHSLGSAMIISFLFPVWFMAFIMPPFAGRIWLIGPAVRVARVVFSPILIVATIFLAIGLWSPDVKESINRWSLDSKKTLANKVAKSSLQSEPEAGIIAALKENSVVYDDNAQVIVINVPKGTPVKVVDLKGEPAARRYEGMTKIMLPNTNKDFVGGREGYVPSRKICWDWKQGQQEAEQKKIEKPAETPAPTQVAMNTATTIAPAAAKEEIPAAESVSSADSHPLKGQSADKISERRKFVYGE